MYVKNFEGETLEETLKAVKFELGPDAIILKTKTNKGMRGVLKKSKIEITAAISEENYLKKMKVDRVLPDEKKEAFYQAPSRYINQAINSYNESDNMSHQSTNSYGNISLNKNVLKSKNESEAKEMMTELDNFLGDQKSGQGVRANNSLPNQKTMINSQALSREKVIPETKNRNLDIQQQDVWQERNELKRKLKLQETKIDQLEEKLYALSAVIDSGKNKNLRGLNQFANTLRSIEVNEKIIQKILKKAQFELSDNELSDIDTVFEFGLREIHESIQTNMPQYSHSKTTQQPTITLIVSEVSSGQSTTCRKLASMQEDVVIISLSSTNVSSNSLADSVFGIPVHQVNNLSEVITLCRKNYIDQKRIFVDLRADSKNLGDTKKLIELLQRSFENIEILINLSAIHSENYNQKIISKYREWAKGLIITHMDLCLNFGQILNLHLMNNHIPLTFFCTGDVVPNDIETATSERLLGALFDL